MTTRGWKKAECKRGHVAPERTKQGACVPCRKLYRAEHYQQDRAAYIKRVIERAKDCNALEGMLNKQAGRVAKVQAYLARETERIDQPIPYRFALAPEIARLEKPVPYRLVKP